MKYYIFYPPKPGMLAKLQEQARNIGQARTKVELVLANRKDLCNDDVYIEDEVGRVVK